MERVIKIINKKIEHYENYINQKRFDDRLTYRCDLFRSKVSVLEDLLKDIEKLVSE